MRKFALLWASAAGLAAALLLTPGTGRADLDAKIKASLDKIVAAIQKGDAAGAKKEAQALAKKVEELNEVMHGFKLRTKGGLGVGSKAGVSEPDGIELRYNAIDRDGISKAQAEKEAQGLVEAALYTAAIAEVAGFSGPEKNRDKGRTKAKWAELTEGMRDGAKALLAAATDKNEKAIKQAVVKLNNSCNTCHMIFR